MIDEVMQSALDAFVAALNADAGDITLRESGGSNLRCESGFGSYAPGSRSADGDDPVLALVYATGRPVAVTDYATEPPAVHTRFAGERVPTATLAVPLIVRSQVIGVLSAHMLNGPREFTEAEIELAAGAAASLALVIDNERLLDSERVRTAHTEALNEVTNLSVSALEPREVATRALDYVVDRLGISAAAAWQKTDDATMRLIAAVNFPQAYVDLVRALPLDTPFDNVKVAVTGEPIVAEDLSKQNPASQQRFASTGAHVGAYAIVPIVSKYGVIGVLGFTWPEARSISKEDVDFYVAIAGQLGVGLENARLFEAEKRELARMQLLQDLTLSAATETDPAAVARAAIAALHRHLGMKMGDVESFDRERQELVLLAAYGYPDEILEGFARISASASGHLTTRALRDKRLVTHEDEDLTPERVAFLESVGVTGDRYMQMPLVHQDRVVGVFGLTFEGRRAFTEEEKGLYLVVARVLAQAIENARLFQAERLRAGRMEVLRDVAELAASSLDPEHVTALALASAVEHIGVRAASVWLVEGTPRILRLTSASGFPEEFFGEFADGLTMDAPFDVARAVRTGEPVIHENAATSDVSANVSAAYRRYGIPLGALVVLPLRAGADVIGALTLAWTEQRRFDADSLAFDIALANTFSTALANARLFEEVRDYGERIAEIIDSMGDAFMSLDREWRYTLVNPRAAAMLGRPARELVGERMGAGFPEAAGWQYLNEVMEERVPVTFESYAETTGTWLEVHAYPTLDGISMYVSDITERKAAQERLDRVTRLLDAHISNSPLAVVEFDAAFHVVRWSDGAERMFGWTAEEVLGKAIGDFRWVYEEDAPLVERESAGLFTGETPRSLNTNRNYRKDGAVLWCEWYSSAIYDADGLVSTFSQVLDITDRRNAEEAVRGALAEVADERTRLRQIIDEIPVGVALMGPDGAVLEINDETNRIWAGTLPKAQSIDGFVVYEGYHHDTDEPMRPDQWPGPRAITSGRAESSFIDIVRLDHTIGVLRVSALPIFGAADELTRVVVISEDVTEQIDAQRLAASLNEISLKVSSTLDGREILGHLTVSGGDAFGTQSAAAIVRRDGGWVVETGVGIPAELVGRTLGDIDALAIDAIFQQAQPVLAPDAQQDTRVMGGKLAELGATSVIALPLISHGTNAGALFFWHTGRRRDFSETQLAFARKLMTVATLALDNAHLYEREHRIAQTLQEAILTPPEPVEGLEIAYLYRPASAVADVGGDFYDVVAVESGRVGFVVGDVSGKGIEAARFTTLMKAGVRAFLLEGDSPARALERLNTLAWRSTPAERFATAFLGVLDVSTGSLSHSGAGHPPALVVGPDGVRRLPSSTGLLGAWGGLTFDSCECGLGRGEVLVMYTDGVTEARRAGELFGEDRLAAVLEGLQATPVADMPRAVLDAVLEFSGGTLRDDVVILCIARTP